MKNKVKLLGEFVKEIAESKNLNPTELSRLINYTKQNVSDIYKRRTIDSELILTLSKVLNYNVFSYYEDKEPIAGFRQAEALEWQSKLDKLIVELKSMTEQMNKQEDMLKQQDDIIRLLKEKEAFLKNNALDIHPRPLLTLPF